MELFDEIEAKYAPLDDPVFELVPALFHECANKHYTELGQPVVSSATFWDTYRNLLQCFHDTPDAQLTPILTSHQDTVSRPEQDNEMPLLLNMKPFRNGHNVAGQKGKYIGGLVDSESTSVGAQIDPEYADFTTDDDDNED